jgi:ribosomal protein S21
MRRRNEGQNFDRLLRNFRNKVKRSGKLEKLREKEYYEKPAQRKQRLKNAAKRREAKRHAAEQLPPLRGRYRGPLN